MVIRHIAIDGSGPFGLISLGCLRRLRGLGVYDNREIKSFHGISSGALASVVLALDIDWKTLEDYFVRRPWDVCVRETMASSLDLRMDTVETTRIILSPLLTSHGLSESATLEDLYKKTGKDVYITTTVLQVGEAVTPQHISRHSDPALAVIDACARSCALFPLFKEVRAQSTVFVDGGFSTGNCSLTSVCACGFPSAETLHIHYKPRVQQYPDIGSHWTTALALVDGLRLRIRSLSVTCDPVATIELPCSLSGLAAWSKFISDEKERYRLIRLGARRADLFVGRQVIDKLLKSGSSGL